MQKELRLSLFEIRFEVDVTEKFQLIAIEFELISHSRNLAISIGAIRFAIV